VALSVGEAYVLPPLALLEVVEVKAPGDWEYLPGKRINQPLIVVRVTIHGLGNPAAEGGREKAKFVAALPLRQDWTYVRNDAMMNAVQNKFAQSQSLGKLLLSTKNYPLVSIKVDQYWGIGLDGRGANTLGKMLRDLREELAGWQERAERGEHGARGPAREERSEQRGEGKEEAGGRGSGMVLLPWFEHLFGFTESADYNATKKNFLVQGDYLPSRTWFEGTHSMAYTYSASEYICAPLTRVYLRRASHVVGE
jgi:hypothetical protein